MLSAVEQRRASIARSIAPAKKSQLGQFFTPERTARFMASLFPDATGDCRLLDAGAGIGSLSAAFLDRWQSGGFNFRRVVVDAFEIDPDLTVELSETLDSYGQSGRCESNVSRKDFILAAVDMLERPLFSLPSGRYSHAILNPPYKKIRSDSLHRRALRRVGIETGNLYSAFVSLAVALSAPGGQIVAIIPRSFCNGPYFRAFRDFILEHAAIRHMHLFGSRNRAFRDDGVLQENVIIRLERDGVQGPVMISTSTDDTFADLVAHEHPFGRVVLPDDPNRFIHIPTSSAGTPLKQSPGICHALDDLGISVSTGPVVDFRLREHLRDMPREGAAPLLYPAHFRGGIMDWPIKGMKKPNAIERNDATERWLFPTGFYCVVRRFSSKEEKRRIVASVVEPGAFGSAPMLGFENHLNVFHENRRGLPEPLARGLAAFLNSTMVDEAFRLFNGHTQVNAADLRQIKYPSRAALMELGKWIMRHGPCTQDQIDARLEALTG